MRHAMAVFLMVGVVLGVGNSTAWAERTEAIAVVTPIHPHDWDQSAESRKPVITLLAVFHKGKWISGEDLQTSSRKNAMEKSPPMCQDIYEALAGRTFVPADGSPGRFKANDEFYSYKTGNVYVLGCEGTRPLTKGERTVVVTKRLSFTKPEAPPLPKRSVFIPFARRAIEAREQEDLETDRKQVPAREFKASPELPVEIKELKPVVLPFGRVVYWVLAKKVYEQGRYPGETEGCAYTYCYYGLFSGVLPGHWRTVWESTDGANCDGKRSGFFSVPTAFCDVNDDSSPEVVLPEAGYEESGWRTFELRAEKLEEVGSVMLGY